MPGKTWRLHSLSAKRLSICPAHHKTLSLASESRNVHYDTATAELSAKKSCHMQIVEEKPTLRYTYSGFL